MVSEKLKWARIQDGTLLREAEIVIARISENTLSHGSNIWVILNTFSQQITPTHREHKI
jgi:hypothetical protein